MEGLYVNFKIQMLKYKIKRKFNIKSYFNYTVELFDISKNGYNEDIKIHQWMAMGLTCLVVIIFCSTTNVYNNFIQQLNIEDNRLFMFLFKDYPFILIAASGTENFLVGVSKLFRTREIIFLAKKVRLFLCVWFCIVIIPLDIISNFAKKGQLDFVLIYFQEVFVSLLWGSILSFLIYKWSLEALIDWLVRIDNPVLGEKTAIYICTLFSLIIFNILVIYILRIYFSILYKTFYKKIKKDKFKVFDQFKVFKTDMLLVFTLLLKALVINEVYSDYVDALFYSTTIFSLFQRSATIRKQINGKKLSK